MVRIIHHVTFCGCPYACMNLSTQKDTWLHIWFGFKHPNSAFAKLAFLWNFVFCALSRTQKLISLSSGEAEMYASKLLPLQCTLFEKFTVFLNWSTSAPGPPVAFDMQLRIWRTKCTCPVVCCGWEIFWQITPYLQAQVHSKQCLGYQPSIHNKSGNYKKQRFSTWSILEKHPFCFSQIPQKLEHIFMLTYHRFMIIVSLESWGSWELGGCIFLPARLCCRCFPVRGPSSLRGSWKIKRWRFEVSTFWSEALQGKTPRSSSELSVKLWNPYSYCWWLKSC